MGRNPSGAAARGLPALREPPAGQSPFSCCFRLCELKEVRCRRAVAGPQGGAGVVGAAQRGQHGRGAWGLGAGGGGQRRQPGIQGSDGLGRALRCTRALERGQPAHGAWQQRARPLGGGMEDGPQPRGARQLCGVGGRLAAGTVCAVPKRATEGGGASGTVHVGTIARCRTPARDGR
jgi:hypothetical protein